MKKLCPNCSHYSTFTLLTEEDLNTCSCQWCLGWHYNCVDKVNFDSLYGQSYFNGSEYFNYESASNIQKLNFLRKMKILTRYIDGTCHQKWLEVGAATGIFYEVLRDNFDVKEDSYIGIELSEYARNQAKTNGINLYSPQDPDMKSIIRNFKPTVIIAWDVWEHLPNPASVFAEICALSAAKAIIAITTVDAGSAVAKRRKLKWRQYHPPTHINYPTQKSFQDFFTTQCCRICHQKYFGYYRPLAEYFKVFGSLGCKIANSFPLSNKKSLYLNLYDTQFVIAEKV